MAMEVNKRHVTRIPNEVLHECIEYYPAFFRSEESKRYLVALLNELEFAQGEVKIFNRTLKEPRLTHAATTLPLDSTVYRYSGKQNRLHAMHPLLIEIKERIEAQLGRGIRFNLALVNWYRNERDYVSWHSDDGERIDLQWIGSVSFGETRRFCMRLKQDHMTRHEFGLAAGDLLLMKARCQELLQHQVPKSTVLRRDQRVNITFRILRT